MEADIHTFAEGANTKPADGIARRQKAAYIAGRLAETASWTAVATLLTAITSPGPER